MNPTPDQRPMIHGQLFGDHFQKAKSSTALLWINSFNP